MKNLGIYVHIPFCKKKCDYCDFISFSNENNMQEEYVKVLCNDIENTSSKIKNYEVNTIYFGGGTPSYISENLIVQTLEKIKSNYKIADDAEITIEVNPRNSEQRKIRSL